MFCEHCGSPLEEGARFCTNCGMPVEPLPGGPAGPAGNPIEYGGTPETHIGGTFVYNASPEAQPAQMKGRMLSGRDEEAAAFEEELIAAMTTPIQDPDSASAVVPLLIRGPGELGALIKLFKFERSFDPALAERADRLVLRGVERDPLAAQTARDNLARNGLVGEIVTGDLRERPFPALSYLTWFSLYS